MCVSSGTALVVGCSSGTDMAVDAVGSGKDMVDCSGSIAGVGSSSGSVVGLGLRVCLSVHGWCGAGSFLLLCLADAEVGSTV